MPTLGHFGSGEVELEWRKASSGNVGGDISDLDLISERNRRRIVFISVQSKAGTILTTFMTAKRQIKYL